MSQQRPEELRLESIQKLFPDYQDILTSYQELLAGLLIENVADVYDEFMETQGYQWNEEKQEYIPKPTEDDVRFITRLSS